MRHYIRIDYAYGSVLDAQRMKNSLEKALAVYYPATGRLLETADGGLVIEAIGTGIPFVEATCSARGSASFMFAPG